MQVEELNRELGKPNHHIEPAEGSEGLQLMAQHLQQNARRFTLHYCAGSKAAAPLLAEAQGLFGESLRGYFPGDGTSRFDAVSMLAHGEPGVHVYCCGPNRLVEAVRCATANWPARQVHFEMFAPASYEGPLEPFEISIASTGQVIHVPADRSALSALRENGYRLASSCEIGVCGSCECGYRSGKVIHRDVVLDAEQRAARMLPCVSRAEGCVVLDL